mmetsp:Transcript_20029/g.33054  ORF Transcript_20029/g.33054 Transcript_20029/m.33054 type:complete len:413 (+) Transcript_20029:1062-2300(+)
MEGKTGLGPRGLGRRQPNGNPSKTAGTKRKKNKQKTKPAPMVQPGQLAIFGAKKLTNEQQNEAAQEDNVVSPVSIMLSKPDVSKKGPIHAENHLDKYSGGPFKVLDEEFRFRMRKDAVLPENKSYRIVGAIGSTGTGKSSILNALGGCEFETSKGQMEHCTRGLDGCFCTIGGERVLLLDCQPVLCPSYITELAELAKPRANISIPALAATREVQLIVFLLHICDSLLVIQDYDSSVNYLLWKLIRYAYVAKSGDALEEDCADLVLVQNKTPREWLDNATCLIELQKQWLGYFGDLVPHAAHSPRLSVAPIGTPIDNMELGFLRRILLFSCFERLPQAWDSGLHYNMAHRALIKDYESRQRRKPTNTVARKPRVSESNLIDHCNKLWTKDIPESTNMCKFQTCLSSLGGVLF